MSYGMLEHVLETTCHIRCPMREHTTSGLLSWINEIQFVLNRGRIFKGILCNPMWRLKVKRIKSEYLKNIHFLNMEIF